MLKKKKKKLRRRSKCSKSSCSKKVLVPKKKRLQKSNWCIELVTMEKWLLWRSAQWRCSLSGNVASLKMLLHKRERHCHLKKNCFMFIWYFLKKTGQTKLSWYLLLTVIIFFFSRTSFTSLNLLYFLVQFKASYLGSLVVASSLGSSMIRPSLGSSVIGPSLGSSVIDPLQAPFKGPQCYLFKVPDLDKLNSQ